MHQPVRKREKKVETKCIPHHGRLAVYNNKPSGEFKVVDTLLAYFRGIMKSYDEINYTTLCTTLRFDVMFLPANWVFQVSYNKTYVYGIAAKHRLAV